MHTSLHPMEMLKLLKADGNGELLFEDWKDSIPEEEQSLVSELTIKALHGSLKDNAGKITKYEFCRVFTMELNKYNNNKYGF